MCGTTAIPWNLFRRQAQVLRQMFGDTQTANTNATDYGAEGPNMSDRNRTQAACSSHMRAYTFRTLGCVS